MSTIVNDINIVLIKIHEEQKMCFFLKEIYEKVIYENEFKHLMKGDTKKQMMEKLKKRK